MLPTLIGHQFANFRILRLLGRGGMSEVYYGWDVKLQRPVAIKVIDARYRDDPSYAGRLVNEARAMAAWHHPNILQIYYADDEQGFYYFVMEYIRGLDLGQILSQYAEADELIPYEDVIRIGRATASALDYAHLNGVIHRDVKPSNLLISEDGRVVLMDFGLAMNVHQGSQGQVLGSPHYIAPEQVRNSAGAVSQSDLYSLGVMLYEMLVGSLPFDDPSPTALALQHLMLGPPPPRNLNPRLSQDVEAVLLKALHKSPGERYQTGQQLMDALEAALRKVDVTAPVLPVLTAERTAERPQRMISNVNVAERVASHVEAQLPIPPVAASPAPPVSSRSSAPVPLRWWAVGCGVLLAISAIALVFVSAYTLRRPNANLSLNTTPAPTRTQMLSKAQPPSVVAVIPPLQTATQIIEPARTSPVVISQTTSPTNLPPSATPTIPNTSTSTETQTPPPSPQPAQSKDGDYFTLYYDDTGLYFKNLSGKDRSIYPIAFERLDKDGQPVNRFEGWRWGNIYSNFRAGYCMVLEIINVTQHLNPPECKNRHLVIRTPTSDQDYIFWTKDKSSKEFRVLWNGEEAGRCRIAKNFCEVYLPKK